MWSDYRLVYGRLLPNRPHRHISASVLVGVDGPFHLQVQGRWRETRAALVAPDVSQALDPGTRTLWIAQMDPDAEPWLRLRGHLQGQPTVDLALPSGNLSVVPEPSCEGMAQYFQRLVALIGHFPEPLDPRVHRVCRLLRETLPEKLEVSVLASQVNLSASRLTHLFRQHTGVPLRRFLLHLKMSRALGHWQPGKPFSELALEAGFYDQPHMVRTARDMFDALPSRYINSDWFQVCRCGLPL
ncbi:helix-turn-helix domain-containing protein [Marinobacter caseinilyticus]|uniref:helix-turn-helix domain-containing protein n=1 Tax=Marinobacter caseinilyticus TaxID=2692195 RepID=UPI001F22029B|nr:AraC family transcriptional regulator [Marinobacter caseinilyticus]